MRSMIAQSIVNLFAFVGCIMVILAKKKSPVLILVCVVIGTIATWLLTQRDIYLPFLGYAALPPTLIKDRFMPNNANVEAVIEVDAIDGTRVLYWGAKSSDEVKPSPWKAYDDWSNAGVAIVKDKKAIVIFHCPGQYEVGMRGKIDRHMHYRVLNKAMLGPVKTAYVKC